MRLASLLLGSLMVTSALHPLQAQQTQPSANSADFYKAQQFEVARASGFDFAQLSDLTRRAAELNGNRPPDSKTIVLDPKQGRLLANGSVCYTLRVYKFAQEDGEAPRMVGSTTCTPAQSVEPKAAEGTDDSGRKVRYIQHLFHPL